MVEVATPGQEGVVDAVLQLPLSTIDVGKRIGLFHEDKAAALGRLIAVDGQRDPIKVVKLRGDRWRLVTGLHRLRGMEAEGFAAIDAIEVQGSPERLRDIEASENVHRRTFGPLERAMFTAAIAQAAEDRLVQEHGELSQQQIAIKARWERVRDSQGAALDAVADAHASHTADTMSGVYDWQESVSEALGLSTRQVRRDLLLYHGIVQPMPDLVEPLAAHPIVGENASALRDIAGVQSLSSRRRLVATLLDHPAMTVSQARESLGLVTAGAPLSPADKHTNAVRSGWSRLSVSDRRAFLPEFVELLTPGMRDDLRQLLNGAEAEA